MNKKVAIIGTVGLPSKYGGFETLAEYLTKYLAKDFDMTVYCSAKSYEIQQEYHNNAKMEYINLHANGIQSIPYDIVSIFKALKYADTLLILGVSGCIVLPFVRMFSSKKIVVNIDGLEWKRAKWNKYAKWFLKFSEKIAVKNAHVVVTDNKVIQEYVLDEYGKKSELIAYGADHVKKLAMSEELRKQYPFIKDDYAFSVCRIEPENNIHIIVEAMSQQKKYPLVLIGNWDSSQYGRNLREKYKLFEHIHLLNSIYDQDILNEIRSNCFIYLHGHSAGGTNPSLVEAMALGLSIVAYGVNYNKETTNNEAIYFQDTKELLEIVQNIEDTKLLSVASSMKRLAEEKYNWGLISSKYAKLMG